MRKNLLVFFILLLFILPSAALANDPAETKNSSVTITAAEREMAETITAKQLKEYLYFVASDEMGGRDTPSRGLDLTAKFMAMMLSRWGFTPAGDDGTFFQKMMVRKETINPQNISLKMGDKEFDYGNDILRVSGNNLVEGKLVYGGNGWMSKSANFDAFAGVDVKDKIVVIYNPVSSRSTITPRPENITDEDLKGEQGKDWADPITNAKMNGAKGIIFIATSELEKLWRRVRRNLSGGTSIEGLRATGAAGDSDLPMLLVRSNVAKTIFDGEIADQTSTKAFETQKTAQMKVMADIERAPTQNVVALWEGSDPVLKKEMVALGAHYDHVGTREDASGEDKIWNGADDDGSGTVAVLAIAEALAKAKQRPKRSILLVWHTGEEKGLLGAAYFNKYPTVDIKNVVVQLNIDMIGRSRKPGDTNPKNKELTGPNEVYVIGSEMMSSKLGEITKGTNSEYLKVDYNYKYDDPKDKNGFFFRSDHFHYARNGIPIVFWFTGTHEDYHGAGDHADKIDYDKMEKIARTIFLTAWELTELDERPAVDKQLPPELTQRD